jgi:DedD protein
MDKALKQRLIGAAILIALAVIFIPMLLEGPKENDPVSMQIEIPAKPAYEIPNRLAKPPATAETEAAPVAGPETSAQPVLQPPTVIIPPAASTSDVAPVPADDAGEKVAAPEPPAVKSEMPKESVPAVETAKTETVVQAEKIIASDKGFVVQVGSFSQRENAVILSDKLMAAGFPAFVESGKSKDASIYRVKVGPQATREAADKLRQRLQDEQRLKGIIVSHP